MLCVCPLLSLWTCSGGPDSYPDRTAEALACKMVSHRLKWYEKQAQECNPCRYHVKLRRPGHRPLCSSALPPKHAAAHHPPQRRAHACMPIHSHERTTWQRGADASLRLFLSLRKHDQCAREQRRCLNSGTFFAREARTAGADAMHICGRGNHR